MKAGVFFNKKKKRVELGERELGSVFERLRSVWFLLGTGAVAVGNGLQSHC